MSSATQLARVAQSAKVQNYASGAAQAALDRMVIAKAIAPIVKVPGTAYEYWAYDSRSPYKIMNTKRAQGAGGAILDSGGSKVNAVLQPNAIDAPIDEAEKLAEGTLVLTLQERADEAAEAAALAHEYEVIVAALAAAGAGTDVNASQASSVDLKKTFDDAILALIKIGKSGSNVRVQLVFGASAGVKFVNHQSIRSLFTGANAKSATATPSLDEVSALLLGKPNCIHALTVYDAAVEGLAASLTWQLDNAVLIFISSDSPTRRDPSFMKTFALGGENGIMRSGTYMSADGRQEFAKLDWYTKPTVTNSAAIRRINLNDS